MQDKITYLKSFTEQLEAQLEKEKGKYLKLKELLEERLCMRSEKQAKVVKKHLSLLQNH